MMEIVTPNTVCPELVTVAEFGNHSSYVRANERIWTFESDIMANKFLKIAHLPRFHRRKDADGKQ